MPNLQNDENLENQSSNNIPGEGADLSPYQNRRIAHGGWTQSPSDDKSDPYAIGSDSIISPKFPDDGHSYSITCLKGRGEKFGWANPNYLIDKPGEKPYYDLLGNDWSARKPTTSAIIQWAKENEGKKSKGGKGNKRPYKYTDFVFCKHWNKIPNNYMITLRRYAYPVYDNLEFPGENGANYDSSVTPSEYYSPIAQAITYMGSDTGNDISNILSFSAELPYSKKTSEIHKVSAQGTGAEDGPGSGIARVLGILTGEANFETITGRVNIDPYEGGPYANKIYGPINVIKDTMIRERGLNFNQKFSIKFHYVARPIGNVNTKAIMLEIIANLLVLCYAEGGFWGGAHRFTSGNPKYPFLGGKAGAQAWYNGDIGGFIDAFTQQLADAGETLGAIFNSILDNPIEGLKSMAAGGAKLGIAQQIAKRNVLLAQIPALLTGAPVGEWHLTIGNPFNPILEIGNLVCTGVEFEFGKELGPDDFPLELTATVNLEHGMGRDKAAIESMFNRGGGKIYHLPDEYQFNVGANGGKVGENAPDTKTGSQFRGKNVGKNSVHKKTNDFQVTQSETEKIENSIGNLSNKVSFLSSKSLEFIKYGYGYATKDKNN